MTEEYDRLAKAKELLAVVKDHGRSQPLLDIQIAQTEALIDMAEALRDINFDLSEIRERL